MNKKKKGSFCFTHSLVEAVAALCPHTLTQTSTFLLPKKHPRETWAYLAIFSTSFARLAQSCTVMEKKKSVEGYNKVQFMKNCSMSQLLLVFAPIHCPKEVLVFQLRFLSRTSYFYTFIRLYRLNTNQTPATQYRTVNARGGRGRFTAKNRARSHL